MARQGFAQQARVGIASDHSNGDHYRYRKNEHIALAFLRLFGISKHLSL